MAEPVGNQGKLYTLSEISEKSKISMPTLQRYKKMYQGRIPAEGKGRKQRYPESALAVFEEIRTENLGRRGRPRKDPNAPRPAASGRKPAAAPAKAAAKAAAKTAPKAAAKAAPARRGRPPGSKTAAKAAAPAAPARRGRPPGSKTGVKAAPAAAAKPAAKGKLLTLTEISKLAGISYPTLVRYVKAYADRLPHEGKGRARRFYQEAVNVFRQLRSEGGKGGRKPAAAAAEPAAKRRGRPPGSGKKAAAPAPAQDAGLVRRLREIEKSHLDLEKRFRELAKGLQKLFR